MASQTINKRPRLFYLDFVRAIAVVLIVITHFNNPFLADRPIFANEPFGIYIGGWGVSLFLIISGAALMYTHDGPEHMDLRTFYWKRFKAIYPMFWIAFIIANAYLFLHNGAIVAAQAPKWSLIFSVLAVDGFLANAGIPTFYTLGEWFLGFIIIFYIAFPLLRAGVKKHPYWTAAIIAAAYAITIFAPLQLHGMPKDLLLTTRLPELIFGMYFVRYIKKVPHIMGVVALAVLVVQQFTTILSGNIAVTVVGIASFLVLVWISEWVNIRPVRTVIKSLSKYSYPIFLVHHQVIIQIFSKVNFSALGTANAYLLFTVDFMIIMGLSIVLFKLNKSTIDYVKSMFIAPVQSTQA